MSATQILDGRILADTLKGTYTNIVTKLKADGITPKLAVIMVGDDPASEVYVNQKEKLAKAIGMDFERVRLAHQTQQDELNQHIERLNEDPSVNGMLVQFPIPAHLSKEEVTLRISPEKDVDGFHPLNLGKLLEGSATFLPCTPRGIFRLLKYYNIELVGKDVTVVGFGEVGKPLSLMLANERSTVTITHKSTRDLAKHLKQADVVISAAGVAGLIKADDIKEGAVVIDVGINRLANNKLVGDVDYEAVYPLASAITPVPGGVGPMTVAMLIEQTLLAAILQQQLNPLDYFEGEDYVG